MRSEVKNYNPIARAIHWLSAILVIAMFGVGIWMVDLSYYSGWYKTAPHWHKSVGLLLAALTLFRLVWKFVTASPRVGGHRLEIVGAKLAHMAMYVLFAILFISGYLISTEDGRAIDVFNWFSVPALGALFENQADISGQVHFYAAWALIILAAIHALAAIKHHVISKDDTLKKMLGINV